jgi:hypothetical protein
MEAVELRAVIASKQGLSCSGYYALAARTAYLRERLYVSVRDGDKLFLPQGPEHFPVKEIEAYYLGRLKLGVVESIGAGGGEVVFSCEGSSAQAADEGATVITTVLAGLDGVLNQAALSRFLTSAPEKYSYVKAVHYTQERPYRPSVLPARSSVPASFTPEERKAREEAREEALSFFETFEHRKREKLKEWGLLDGYEEMQAGQKARLDPVRTPRPALVSNGIPGRCSLQSFYSSPWKESPWK